MELKRDRYRLIAGAVTLIAAVAIIVALMLICLRFDPDKKQVWPPEDTSELLMADEYVELVELPVPQDAANAPSANGDAGEAPVPDGMDPVESGEVAPQPPVPVASDRPSPMKVKTPEKPEKTGAAESNERENQAPARQQKQPDPLPIKDMKYKGKSTQSGTATSGTGSGAGNKGTGPGASVGVSYGGMSGRSMSGAGVPAVRSSEILEGKMVTVEIWADPDGRLIGEPVKTTPTTVADNAVIQACITAAKSVKITPKADAQPKQRGIITFRFSNK